MIDIRDFKDNGDDSYKNIWKRFEDLIDLIDPYEEVITKYYKNKDGLTNLEEYIDSIEEKDRKIIAINLRNRTLIYKEKQNNIVQAPYICIKYFDGFTHTRENIYRYSFFEFYSIAGILSVLMREPRFTMKNQEFRQFDLNQDEWRQAIKQLNIWGNHIYCYPVMFNYTSKPQIYLEEYFERIDEEYNNSENSLIHSWDMRQNEIGSESSELIVENWAFLSYITMIQVLPAIRKKNKRYPYLNLIIDGIENGMENSLKTIVSTLTLRHKKVKEKQIVVTSQTEALFVSKKNNIPRLIVVETDKALNRVTSYIFDREENSNSDTKKAADYYPALISNKWIIDYRYIDYEIKMESIARLGKESQLLKKYRNLLDYNLSARFDEDFMVWEDYCDNLIADFKRIKAMCKKWWTTNRISMLSSYYIDLLSWFTMTISINPKFDLNNSSSLILQGVLDSVRKYDETLSSVFNTYLDLLKIIVDIPLTNEKDMPSSIDEVESLDVPVCVIVSGEEIVMFTDISLKIFVNEHSRIIDDSKFIKLCRQKSLLKVGKKSSPNDNRLTHQFKIKPIDDKTRHGKRVFQFVKERIKLFLTSGVTVEVTGSMEEETD